MFIIKRFTVHSQTYAPSLIPFVLAPNYKLRCPEQTIWAASGAHLCSRSNRTCVLTHTSSNFARSRAKDTVGRAQRHHFGRQRMQHVLSRGLNSTRTASGGDSDRSKPEISLAHARRDSTGDERHRRDPEMQDSHPVEQRSPSPGAQSAASRSSQFSRSSRIVQVLNANDRRSNPSLSYLQTLTYSTATSTRVAVLCILETPDLAGIGRLRKPHLRRGSNPDPQLDTMQDFDRHISPGADKPPSPDYPVSPSGSIANPIPRTSLYPSFAAMNAASEPSHLHSSSESDLFLGDPRLLDPDSHTELDSLLAHQSPHGLLNPDLANPDFGMPNDIDMQSQRPLYSNEVSVPMHESPFALDYDTSSGAASPSLSYTTEPAYFTHATSARLRHHLPFCEIRTNVSTERPFAVPQSHEPSALSQDAPHVPQRLLTVSLPEYVEEQLLAATVPSVESMFQVSSDSDYATHTDANNDDESCSDFAALLHETSRLPSPEPSPSAIHARTDDRRGVGFSGPAPPTPPAWDWGSGSMLFPAPTSAMLAALLHEIHEEYYEEVVGWILVATTLLHLTTVSGRRRSQRRRFWLERHERRGSGSKSGRFDCFADGRSQSFGSQLGHQLGHSISNTSAAAVWLCSA